MPQPTMLHHSPRIDPSPGRLSQVIHSQPDQQQRPFEVQQPPTSATLTEHLRSYAPLYMCADLALPTLEPMPPSIHQSKRSKQWHARRTSLAGVPPALPILHACTPPTAMSMPAAPSQFVMKTMARVALILHPPTSCVQLALQGSTSSTSGP
eukprot:CAMPEP_0202859936 /NCGR_PEP_ID=MMETSP1391-20130828/1853_1 /ASSEMBLY_ACC=CAM_ASM_000867 /TAXON_ID=1034604 /ORGANISM="Chlamydomonas leiostraca, Strain SAG 11-49" /LENGTH=151 /DNA_ID=CAMNT_0049539045 /DNA_START=108 /DNA_END=564 /DNA_ORIENTATION=-